MRNALPLLALLLAFASSPLHAQYGDPAGWFDIREGEASVFKPDGVGGAKVVLRLQAADWIKAAAGL